MKKLIFSLFFVLACLPISPAMGADLEGGVYESVPGDVYAMEVGQLLTFQHKYPIISPQASRMAKLIYTGPIMPGSVTFHVSLDGEDFNLTVHEGTDFYVGQSQFRLKSILPDPKFTVKVLQKN